LSSYVCHPSRANNELSGPVVTTAIGRWIASWPKRRYSYRLVFVPETIGSVVYLSKHLDHLSKKVVAGYVLTCIGDDRGYSTVLSRKGNTLADRVAVAVLREIAPDHTIYSFLDRGSDERQYCSPGVDLPVATLMRSKFGCFPEYHTSLDDCSLVTAAGLAGGFDLAQRAIIALEGNCRFISSQPCEPQLGKRGLYPSLSTPDTHSKIAQMMNVLAYADGDSDCLAISEATAVPVFKCMSLLRMFEQHDLVRQIL
jgi:aminopeptidase-like protein